MAEELDIVIHVRDRLATVAALKEVARGIDDIGDQAAGSNKQVKELSRELDKAAVESQISAAAFNDASKSLQGSTTDQDRFRRSLKLGSEEIFKLSRGPMKEWERQQKRIDAMLTRTAKHPFWTLMARNRGSTSFIGRALYRKVSGMDPSRDVSAFGQWASRAGMPAAAEGVGMTAQITEQLGGGVVQQVIQSISTTVAKAFQGNAEDAQKMAMSMQDSMAGAGDAAAGAWPLIAKMVFMITAVAAAITLLLPIIVVLINGLIMLAAGLAGVIAGVVALGGALFALFGIAFLAIEMLTQRHTVAGRRAARELREFMHFLERTMADLGKILWPFVHSLLPLIEVGIVGIIKAITPAIVSVAQTMRQYILPIMQGVTPVIRDVANVAALFFRQVQPLVMIIGRTLGRAIEMGVRMEPLLLGFARAFTVWFRGFMPVFMQLMRTGMPIFTRFMTGFGRILNSFMRFLAGANGRAAGNAASSFLLMLTRALVYIFKTLGSMAPQVRQFVGFFNTAFMGLLRMVMPQIVAFGSAIMRSLGPQLPQIFNMLGQLINAFISLTPAWVQIVELVNGPLIAAMTLVLNVFAPFINLLGALAQILNSVLLPVLNAITGSTAGPANFSANMYTGMSPLGSGAPPGVSPSAYGAARGVTPAGSGGGFSWGALGSAAWHYATFGLSLFGRPQRPAGFSPHVVHPRQHGGPAFAGMPYLVGERGPELVIPRHDSTVVPMRMDHGGGGQNVHIENLKLELPGVHNPRQFMREFKKALQDELGSK